MEALVTTTPGTVGITQIGVTGNIAEITITVGNTVIAIGDTDEKGNVPLNSIANWLQTFSLSPQVALQLCERLSHALMEYQQAFGVIPRDPRFTLEPGKTLQ